MSEERRPVAVVSGGSRGIGRAVVHRLAADGYDIALCFQSNADAAQATAKVARDLGARVLTRQVDVAVLAECRDLFAATEQELGGLDTVITSAGIVRDKPLVMMAEEEWSDVIDTNLTGTFAMCRAAIFALMKRRGGSIVTISSISGRYGNPGQTNYSASKAGIIGFTRALAKEAGRYGVRANVVAPGFIETDMTAELPEALRAEKLAQIPLGRLGLAEEVAELVAFLASPKAGYITAGVFPIDGGLAI
ncbi:3-oxoacyl-[acyl-carrier-protein] reductase [Longispora fulva]|uniref:3-oxoacyl-[acyl-carrier protein] reductase n=1 Tax=Longispora fulva TaxID=619741 RepID=A0A8J7G7A5_9ACTN|nr:3-oxoacyl-ACP reductase FabG [Longispora fulva]MBG6134330.1 3-oxoacyl-[acyl-carrier protein] reductase [Longispora fulva]GIG63039.1 3-oxoacyl-[acyl-carrier-protein] reductase [Longispora fulva]